MKATDETYYGFNASTKIAKNAVVFAQYAKNNDAADNNQGYWAGVKFGNAIKKGDIDYSLAYVKVDNNINPNGTYFVNDSNWIGAKGLRFKAHYAVSNNSTLTFYQDQFKTIDGNADHKRSDLEYEVRF